MSRKLNTEEIIKKCKEIKPEYEIIKIWRVNENNKNRLWLKVKCNNNHIYDVLYDNFKKAGCPECRNLYMSELNKKYTIEEIETQCKIKNLKWVNKNDIITKTKKEHNNVFILECLICGHILKCNITNLFSERKCGNCSNNIKNSLSRVKQELTDVYGNEYELYGEYNGSREQSIYIHNKCKNTFPASLYNLLNGKTACPYCSTEKSIGEMKIQIFLNNNNIYYEPQYWFNDCRNTNPLPFDFAIFQNNNKTKLIFLIEFDGRQHFEPVEIYGGEEGFIKTKINDNIKNIYCNKNNIILLRIPFWEFKNIDNILSIKLNSKENKIINV